MKCIHFRADEQIIAELDRYRTRWRTRSQILEEAIALWIGQQKTKQVKVCGSGQKQEVRDWRDMFE